jgi:hypothetical protein
MEEDYEKKTWRKEFFFNASVVEDDFKCNRESITDQILGNSVHLFDLCRYLFGDVNPVNFVALPSNLGILANIAGDGKSIVGKVEILFGVAKNTSLELYTPKVRSQLSPIEINRLFDSFSIEEPTSEINIRRYLPTWTGNTEQTTISNSNFKPGFLRQAIEFINFCNGQPSKILATLDDAQAALEFAESFLSVALERFAYNE